MESEETTGKAGIAALKGHDKQLSIRIDPLLRKDLEDTARSIGLTVTGLVRRILREQVGREWRPIYYHHESGTLSRGIMIAEYVTPDDLRRAAKLLETTQTMAEEEEQS